ncbi:MAG: glycosyltransferase family 25 protein [Pseudomonadota bacterium]|nr:glycosyltransferase family 25 protein [Pseudomonadota bacterium]
MKNYVISLPSAVDRRQHILEQFGREQVGFEFFDAIVPDQAQVTFRQWFPNVGTNMLSAGELACLVSHLSVWRQAKAEGLAWVAVFEDDVHLGQDVGQYLNDAGWLSTDWPLIKLETFNQKTITSGTIALSIGQRVLARLTDEHYGAAGYILSRQTIEDFFGQIEQLEQLKPIDHLIFADNILRGEQVFQLTPALCIQDLQLESPMKKLPSSLESYRQGWSRPKTALTFWQKLQREGVRLLRHIRRFVLAKRIDFR